MKGKVYFASPWFTKSQAEREERVKNKLRELGLNVFSPKESDNGLSPITDPKIRKQIFASNINNMSDCAAIFAITDEKDMGTIWEAGFVYGMRHEIASHPPLRGAMKYKPIIIYYCETLGDGMFNLMLAQSGDIVITKFEDLDGLPELIKQVKTGGKGKPYDGIVE